MPPVGESREKIPGGRITAFVLLFLLILIGGICFYQAQEQLAQDLGAGALPILGLAAIILLGTFFIVGIIWQRRQKYYYRNLYEAEAGRSREEQRNRERLETLLRLYEMSSASENELADFVLDAGCRLTDSHLAFTGVMYEDEREIGITAWSGSGAEDVSVAISPARILLENAGTWADAVRQKKPVIVNDYHAPDAGGDVFPPGHIPVTRFASVPVFDGQQIVMICTVANKETGYTKGDVDNLMLLMQGVWLHRRKRLADEALHQKTADLEAAYEEITASDEELAANYDELTRNQQALAESERKYRNLYHYAQVGLFETSLTDAKVVACNERYATLAGFSSVEEAIGSDILPLYANPEDRTEVSRILRETGWIRDHVVRFRNQGTGTIFWGQFSARYNSHRDVAEGSIIDITAQKEAEEQLRENTTRLSLALDVGNAGVWEWNTETNEVRFDAGFHELLGYEHGELPGTLEEWLPFHNEEDLPVWRAKAETYLRGESPMYESEHRIRTKTGEWAWVFTRGQFVTAPEVGPEKLFVGIAMNTTGRRHAEEVLRESEQRFRTMLDWTYDWEYWIRPNREINYVSPSVQRITGYSPDEFIADKFLIDRIIHPEDRALWQEHIVYHTGDTHPDDQGQIEFRIIGREGTVRWIGHVCRPIYAEDGTWAGTRISNRDITDRKNAEEALRESGRRLQEAQGLAHLGFWSWDMETGRVEWSDEVFRIFGLDPDQFKPDIDSILALSPWPGEQQRDRELIQKAIESREPGMYEQRFLRPDRSTGYYHSTFQGRYDEGGALIAIVGTVLDITGRKRVEEQLRETNEYLKNLIDYANAPIIVWDLAFRITRFNHAFERLTGRTEQEVIGRHLEILFPETSRAASLEQIQKTLAGERWEIVEIPILHVSGETRLALWNSANIADPQGKIISTIAQGQDITERKMAEDALRQSEEKYRILFTRMVEGSALHEILADSSGHPVDYRVLDVNPAFESIIGKSRETVIGKTSREAYGVDTPPYLDTYARVAATGQPAWFEVYFAPLKKHFAISAYSPGTGKFATIFEDVTERKLAEELREHLIKELEQKNAELERFTYTVSHDLKSPLITIKGFAGLIEEDVRQGDPLKLKKDLHRIMAAAETMQELLANVLDLARIGKIVNPPEKIAFGRIAEEAVELLAVPLAERNVTIEIAPGLPEVSVDHARIREVLVNLIENAVKFTASRPDPVIRIGADLTGTTPVFFVQDNGIGIEPRYLERIFKLFERLDRSTYGTGIGLTIVQRIIEVHGGKIWAESEGTGKGTTFRFTLPGAKRDPEKNK